MSIADELKKLQELRDAGVLTPEEFTSAKSAILASIGANVTGESSKNQVLREQLEAFKSRFAVVEERTYAEHCEALEEAEDLLIAVCGKERYERFMEDARSIADQVEVMRERLDDRDRVRRFEREIDQSIDSLKRRIAGIEVR